MNIVALCAHRARYMVSKALSGRSPRVSRPTAASSRIALRIAPRIGIVLAAVIGYFGVRGLTDSSQAKALRNAAHVEAAERVLHLDWEPQLQSLVVNDQAITRLLNWIYIYGHWPVIALILIWLLSRHPALFSRAAGAMLLSGSAGLIAFAAFPVAPPRLAALGMTDTVTEQSSAYRVLQPSAFTNQYAAMPSLHVGWNLLMTLAILAATRKIWLRVLAVALTMSMDATVVLTANHYVLDALAGVVLAELGWYAMGRLQNRARRQQRTTTRDTNHPAPSVFVLTGQRG
ncbi:phosphatase PAP2 family protein [Streptomyces sp. NPDC005181]|uniref:phosphatase PAP2 family protein n=1 Tax=Streptomyces sp. NPDC005181 TaxID=3156869 RepID=UPI0033A76945